MHSSVIILLLMFVLIVVPIMQHRLIIFQLENLLFKIRAKKHSHSYCSTATSSAPQHASSPELHSCPEAHLWLLGLIGIVWMGPPPANADFLVQLPCAVSNAVLA